MNVGLVSPFWLLICWSLPVPFRRCRSHLAVHALQEINVIEDKEANIAPTPGDPIIAGDVAPRTHLPSL